MNVAKQIRRIAWSILHGLGLCCFVLFWLYHGYFTDEDRLELKWTELIKRELLHWDEKPRHSIVFVDVSGAKELIPAEKDTADRELITDRGRLARLIGCLNSEKIKYRYILCDVFFQGHSPEDSQLNSSLRHCRDIILAAEMDDSHHLLKPIFDIHSGIVSYLAEDGDFIKLNMIGTDSLASLPLIMFCDLHHQTFKKGIFMTLDNAHFLVKQTIDLRIRPYDLSEGRDFALYNINNLLSLTKSPAALDDLLDGKIIVIGNFKDDKAGSVIGDMPGPLMLTNAYLSLEYKDNRISIAWVLYLLTTLSLLSLATLFYREKWMRLEATFLQRHPTLQLTAKFLGYATCLYAIALGSYLFFHVYINILILSLYFSALDELRKTNKPAKKLKPVKS
jgi:hypothetical protein